MSICFSYMCQKLFALANGKCKPESPDNPMFQEICLPGHLYLMILKVKFSSDLRSFEFFLIRLTFSRRNLKFGLVGFEESWRPT